MLFVSELPLAMQIIITTFYRINLGTFAGLRLLLEH